MRSYTILSRNPFRMHTYKKHGGGGGGTPVTVHESCLPSIPGIYPWLLPFPPRCILFVPPPCPPTKTAPIPPSHPNPASWRELSSVPITKPSASTIFGVRSSACS